MQEKGLDRAKKIGAAKPVTKLEEDNLLSATYTRTGTDRATARHRSFFRSASLGDDRVGAFFGLSALKDPRA